MKQKNTHIQAEEGTVRESERNIHRRLHIIFKRFVYVLIFVAIDFGLMALMFTYAQSFFPYFYVLCTVLSIAVAVHIILKNNNPAYKIAWLIPIFLMPVFGGLLYLFFGTRRVNSHLHPVASDTKAAYKLYACVPTAEETMEHVPDRDAARISACITHSSGCLPYRHTDTTYYPSGEEAFPALLDMLREAKRYIFIEFFIIEEGVFWNAILDILTEKAKAGVDVRVMYDDFGCILTLPKGYENTLRRRGIRACDFNPFNTILSPKPNNRDHRKICVVDGVAAFTGGINLADEYINVKKRLGYWKDTAIMLRGDGAWGLALQFLCLWDRANREKTDIAAFAPDGQNGQDKQEGTDGALVPPRENGVVQPYTDIPMDGEQVGESVYFQMINRAKRYVYVMTPYLILDYEMTVALQIAAKSGVDVRIMTPHIPDKKTVFFLTRSYYKPLLDAGVKIYEFTPGFVHAKSMVVDDKYAVVGTINLDYRSLYLHLENAVWMYGTDAVIPVRDDFLQTQEVCTPMTEQNLGKLTMLKRLWLSVLRTFAPLM